MKAERNRLGTHFVCVVTFFDNLQPKLLPFYRDELLHSRPTDCHQLKAIGVAHIVTAPDLNLSPFAHETSSVEGTNGGKFREVYYMDISFLQLPSHICWVYFDVKTPGADPAAGVRDARAGAGGAARPRPVPAGAGPRPRESRAA